MPVMHDLKTFVPDWAFVARRHMIWQSRRATWFSRALPSFLIVGAQKCGTTSLYDYLVEHPQLWAAYIKEVHFFDGGLEPIINNFQKGEPWYRANFPLKSAIKQGGHTFEASPLYMFNPLAPKRIFELLPNVKLIAVLRNPTERAISHYFHEKRHHREPLDIADAMRAEEKRLAPKLQHQDYKSETFIHLSYKSRGRYLEQLERFLTYFPRENLLILESEGFFQDPSSALRRVCEFVDIDPNFQFNNLKPRNIAPNRVDIPPDVYRYLNSYFSSHNQRLYEFLGKDFSW
ncbi:MAG: sulfotransferase domain-containing protein [Cyanobacteria bacterium J06627_3]